MCDGLQRGLVGKHYFLLGSLEHHQHQYSKCVKNHSLDQFREKLHYILQRQESKAAQQTKRTKNSVVRKHRRPLQEFFLLEGNSYAARELQALEPNFVRHATFGILLV